MYLFCVSSFLFSKCFKSKNLFSAFRTPAVLFVLVCLLYVLSGLLMFIGLSTVAIACDCVVGLAMVAVLSWAFIRYSGRYRCVGGAIDQAAGLLLEQVRGFRGAGCAYEVHGGALDPGTRGTSHDWCRLKDYIQCSVAVFFSSGLRAVYTQ